MLTLVTGPVRSGKSAYALRLARASARTAVYVATATVDPADPEMVERVARHRAERRAMRTIVTDEFAGPQLADVLGEADGATLLLVDSLGTWLGGLLVAGVADLDARTRALVDALATSAADIIVVAEETGWGIVPPTPLGRAFRDRLGRMTAELAGRADRAFLVVAGFAIDLRAVGSRISD
jgi:adenosylcobinamide kinase/adenosylcobinamide-phosphate guanylyltransferase